MKAEGAPKSGCGDPDCMFCIMRRFRLEYSTDRRSWIALATKVGEAPAAFWNNVARQGDKQTPYRDNAPVAYTFPDPDYKGLTPFEARYIRVHLVMGGSTGMDSEYSGETSLDVNMGSYVCCWQATVQFRWNSMVHSELAITALHLFSPTCVPCRCQSTATIPVGIGSYAIPDSALTQATK